MTRSVAHFGGETPIFLGVFGFWMAGAFEPANEARKGLGLAAFFCGDGRGRRTDRSAWKPSTNEDTALDCMMDAEAGMFRAEDGVEVVFSRSVTAGPREFFWPEYFQKIFTAIFTAIFSTCNRDDITRSVGVIFRQIFEVRHG